MRSFFSLSFPVWADWDRIRWDCSNAVSDTMRTSLRTFRPWANLKGTNDVASATKVVCNAGHPDGYFSADECGAGARFAFRQWVSRCQRLDDPPHRWYCSHCE